MHFAPLYIGRDASLSGPISPNIKVHLCDLKCTDVTLMYSKSGFLLKVEVISGCVVSNCTFSAYAIPTWWDPLMYSKSGFLLKFFFVKILFLGA